MGNWNYQPVIDDLKKQLFMIRAAINALMELQGVPADQELSSIPVPRTNEGRKVCNKCGVEKPHADFQRHSQCAGGVAGTCRACVRDRMNQTQKRYRDKMKPGPAPVQKEVSKEEHRRMLRKAANARYREKKARGFPSERKIQVLSEPQKSTILNGAKAELKFDCRACHGRFLSQAALDGHNCIAR